MNKQVLDILVGHTDRINNHIDDHLSEVNRHLKGIEEAEKDSNVELTDYDYNYIVMAIQDYVEENSLGKIWNQYLFEPLCDRVREACKEAGKKSNLKEPT